jgi:RNA polymerase sigma-70 factor (ECF subfamily)
LRAHAGGDRPVVAFKSVLLRTSVTPPPPWKREHAVFDEKQSTEYRRGGILNGPSVWPVVAGRTDGALIDAVIGGDRAALLEVYDIHAAALYGVARRRCGPAQAADVVEAVILGLWHRPIDFPGSGCTLRTFLVARARLLSAALAEHPIERDAAAAPLGVDGTRLGRSVGPTMARRLRRLPGEEREVIELVYIDGHTCSSSGALLDRSPELVAAQLRRGLRGLRTQRAADDAWDAMLATGADAGLAGRWSVARSGSTDGGDPCP